MTTPSLKKLLPVRKKVGTALKATNSYCISEKDYHLNAPCFAYLSDFIGPVTSFVDWPLSRLFVRQGNKKFTERDTRYLNWLVNKSAWKDAFITKNVEEFTSLGIVYNVDLSSRFIIQAAILVRYLAEFPHIVEEWSFWDKYTNGNLAMYLAVIFGVKGNEITLCPEQEGHKAFTSHDIDLKALKRLLGNDPIIDIPMRDYCKYMGMVNIWRDLAEEYQVIQWPPMRVEKELKKDFFGNIVEKEKSYYPVSDAGKMCENFIKLNGLEELCQKSL